MTSNLEQKTGEAQPNRRSKPRTTVPCIKIRCENELYVPEDWGLGGCRIANYEGQLRPGTTVLIEMFLNVVHEHDGLPVKAEVVRFEPENNNSLALFFADLSARDIEDFCEASGKNFPAELMEVMA